MGETDFFPTILHGISVNNEKCGTWTEKEVQKKDIKTDFVYFRDKDRVRHTSNIYGTNWQQFWIFILKKSRLPKMAISLTLGCDKIIVWFRLHTAQKVGSVGRENILFWTILMSSVIINRVKWCKIWKSDIIHTHTRSVADNTLYWVWASMVRCFSAVFIAFQIKICL